LPSVELSICVAGGLAGVFKLPHIHIYEGLLESKERFAIKKIFIDNRKEKEYSGFITHLHLLLHIVTSDFEALVVP